MPHRLAIPAPQDECVCRVMQSESRVELREADLLGKIDSTASISSGGAGLYHSVVGGNARNVRIENMLYDLVR